MAIIRAASAADLPAIEALVAEAYTPWIARIGRRPGPMEDNYAARIAAGEAHVLDNAGAVLGVLILLDGPEALLLDNVAVAPSAIGQGHGRRLIRFAEDVALEKGHQTLRLYAHEKMTENIELYEKLGFVETHRITEQQFDRVYMEKRLVPK